MRRMCRDIDGDLSLLLLPELGLLFSDFYRYEDPHYGWRYSSQPSKADSALKLLKNAFLTGKNVSEIVRKFSDSAAENAVPAGDSGTWQMKDHP
jgi:hypothetical protein